MTKAEILDAINATIAPNNVKGITAESLANILTEIVNATPEGGSGGAGGEYIDLTLANPDDYESDELTAEAMAHNAEVYAKLSSVLSSGGAAPSVVINIESILYAKGIEPDPAGGMALYFDMALEEVNVSVEGTLMDTLESAVVLIGSNNVILKVVVNSDGSAYIVIPNLV